jgi:hypothetical protein
VFSSFLTVFACYALLLLMVVNLVPKARFERASTVFQAAATPTQLYGECVERKALAPGVKRLVQNIVDAIYLVGAVGIEPTTCWLKASYSAN